ncbi:ABC transporter ATP-binding protein [Paludibacter jiangxiensis]|uniref:Iron complex transport system ATP-binding protein n=1 Tax=Paludibacter jiangxiensis TaxID=681398 RepID=A0A170YKK2_9BACT|nr:ABC transporter ATP-binding protein [Paludibacter jiangxiensis]GAT61879.1 iron complex transport system ATP-binding protein [Paludibacter jiangxiensis]
MELTETTYSPLRTSNLAIGYSRGSRLNVVQQHLDLELLSGEMVCMIGPNGCGKSTLLRTLAGLQRPITGSILVDGKNMETLSAQDRAESLALTLTDRVEVDKMSVYEIVAMGRYPYTNRFGRLTEEDRTIVAEALAQVHLEEKAQRYISELSDGERQRAMIAKVLAQSTPLLFFDEPTAHLDLPNRVSIMLLLAQLAKTTGKSILLSTHELELAMQVADKLWLMSDRGVQVGTTDQLIADGSFENVFRSNQFSFNAETGRFIINKPS